MTPRRSRRRPTGPADRGATAHLAGPSNGNAEFGAHPTGGGPLFISERIGARWIWQISPSWAEAAARLRPYPLETVLEVVGRISGVLRAPSADRFDVQRRICAGLFGEDGAVWVQRRVETWLAGRRREAPDAPAASPTLFHQLGLPAVVKVACAACVQDRRSVPSTDAGGNASRAGLPSSDASGRGYGGIGEAILIVNDLLDEQAINPIDRDLDSLTDRLHWVQYAFIGSAVPGSDVATHALARTIELFLSPQADLAEDPDFVDLPGLFTSATGLTVEAYLRVLLAVLTPFLGITPETAGQRNATLPLARWRAAGLGEDIDRVLAFVGADAATFRASVRARYPGPTLHSYDTLVLERAPPVRFGSPAGGGVRVGGPPDLLGASPTETPTETPAETSPETSTETRAEAGPEVIVCHAVGMLQERLTVGLYHTLLNAHAEDDAEGRTRYMRFVGRVFERYVDRACRRMYGAAPAARSPRAPRGARRAAPRYFGEAALRGALAESVRHADQQSICDGLVIVGDTALMLESKARLFPVAARAGEAPDAFRARLEEIVVRGAKQLHRSVEWLLGGAFAPLGVRADEIAHVLPVVVSLQELPTNLLLRWWVDDRLAAEGYLAQTSGGVTVHPLEILDVGDFEWAEGAHAHGGDLINVLRRKHADPWGRNHSVTTYAIVRGLPGAAWQDRNPYLARRYDALTAGPWATLQRLARAARQADGAADHR